MRYVQKNQSIFDSLFGVALLRYEWIFSPAICFFNQQPVIVFDWGRSRAAKMIDEISLCNVARIQRLRGVHSIATGGVLCRPKAQHVAASLRATTRPVAPPASHTRRLAIDQRNGANSKNRAPKITRFFFFSLCARWLPSLQMNLCIPHRAAIVNKNSSANAAKNKWQTFVCSSFHKSLFFVSNVFNSCEIVTCFCSFFLNVIVMLIPKWFFGSQKSYCDWKFACHF